MVRETEMHFVIERDFFRPHEASLWLQAIERLGCTWAFSTDVALPQQVAVCLGPPSMVSLGYSPGVFDVSRVDFRALRSGWGEAVLNVGSEVARLRHVDFVGARFVRPVIDSKTFTGRVWSRDEFFSWRLRVPAALLDVEVQVAPVQELVAETRSWVVRGVCVDSCTYARAGRGWLSRDVPDDLTDFVRARCAEWQPHETFVVDVAQTPHGLRVIEVNTFNAASLYAGDAQRLVAALMDAYE